MITKKKGLHRGLLLLLFGIGNVMQAYTVTIKNNTLHTVKFKLSWRRTPTCNFFRLFDEQKLAAGGIAKIEVPGRCGVVSLEATVQRSGLPAVEVEPLKSVSYPKSFVISGSDETGYTVTKVR